MSGTSAAPSKPAQRWMARAALLAALASVVVLVAFAGAQSIALLLLAAAGLVVTVVGVWLALAHRGVTRLVGVVLAVASQVAVWGIVAAKDLLGVVLVCVALLFAALIAAQHALRHAAPESAPARAAAAPIHAFLIMNPRSGGGKVERFHLQAEAERLGAEVALLDGPGMVDVAELARTAIGNGADLLGVAGGDGTQALVAAVAAENDVPLLVIPAGTRNHFALDLGLDRDDCSLSLEALTDGVDILVDLGDVGGRPFVNNVSFGAYATIVARPDYRDDKTKVTLDVLPQLLTNHSGTGLTVHADEVTVTDPQAALVSNNPYGTGDIAGVGRRARLDGGVLGLVTVSVANAGEAARLLRGRRGNGVRSVAATEVIVDSQEQEVSAGVDGESVQLATPVRCRVRPGALRVRVPRNRLHATPVQSPITLSRLVRLAAPRFA